MLFYWLHFFARSEALVPRSLLLNCTETLATQAIHIQASVWSKNTGGGTGSPGPSPGSATATSLLWVLCQVRGSSLVGP